MTGKAWRKRREGLPHESQKRRAHGVAKPCRGLLPTHLSLPGPPSGDTVSPAKGIFAFHNFGEQLIGLFGRLSLAPPPDSESAGKNPGQTTHDNSHLITHDDSLVQPHFVGKVVPR